MLTRCSDDGHGACHADHHSAAYKSNVQSDPRGFAPSQRLMRTLWLPEYVYLDVFSWASDMGRVIPVLTGVNDLSVKNVLMFNRVMQYTLCSV